MIIIRYNADKRGGNQYEKESGIRIMRFNCGSFIAVSYMIILLLLNR